MKKLLTYLLLISTITISSLSFALTSSKPVHGRIKFEIFKSTENSDPSYEYYILPNTPVKYGENSRDRGIVGIWNNTSTVTITDDSNNSLETLSGMIGIFDHRNGAKLCAVGYHFPKKGEPTGNTAYNNTKVMCQVHSNQGRASMNDILTVQIYFLS